MRKMRKQNKTPQKSEKKHTEYKKVIYSLVGLHTYINYTNAYVYIYIYILDKWIESAVALKLKKIKKINWQTPIPEPTHTRINTQTHTQHTTLANTHTHTHEYSNTKSNNQYYAFHLLKYSY